MDAPISILSTKVISPTLRESLLSKQFKIVDRDFISIQYNEMELDHSNINSTVLITSKNVIKSLIQSTQISILRDKDIYCVGSSVPQLLEPYGISVQGSFPNAYALGEHIVSQNISKATFLCGNKSRPELPNLLKKNNVKFQKIELYTTVLTPHKLDESFDALLFFCPSAVESYLTDHQITTEKIICIGQTTASAVRPFSNHIILADQHKVSSVIHKTIELFQQS